MREQIAHVLVMQHSLSHVHGPHSRSTHRGQQLKEVGSLGFLEEGKSK